jgi:hypothetical protein
MSAATASVAAMRPWLRFTSGLLGLVALYAIYLGVSALLGNGALPRWAGALVLGLSLSSLVPALLIWQMAEAATRYLNEPTTARLQELTATMRRFWRLSGLVAVLQLTAIATGAALHGGL